MASFEDTYKRVMVNESGYAPAFGGSGETYKGIDRKYNPQWPGWGLIYAYKSAHGVPPRGFIITGSILENMVFTWYRDVYFAPIIDVTKFQSQALDDFIAAFIVHKLYDAVRVINITASQIYSVTTASTTITQSVINLILHDEKFFYTLLKRNRILYYTEPGQFGSKYKFSPPMITAFVNRVNTFPETV